jgi:hypothetical protein
MRHLATTILVAGALAPLLFGRSDHHAEAQATAVRSDTLLLGDISQAIAEFKRRLRSRVTVQDRMVLVSDIPDLKEIEGFPTRVSWSISCGLYFGLSVTFGSGTSHDGGIIDVELSNAPLTESQCREVVPALAKEIATLLR